MIKIQNNLEIGNRKLVERMIKDNTHLKSIFVVEDGIIKSLWN